MADSAGGEVQWYFSQVKGTMEDEVNEADIISTVEFNEDGELLATGDKGGRIVIFQREQPTKSQLQQNLNININNNYTNMNTNNLLRTEYNVYSTFQSHEAEFDYLKSLEIEEKINKIKWLKRKNMAHFLLSTNDKTVKLWKIRERNKRAIMSSSSSTADSISLTTNASASLQMLNGGSNTHINVREDGFIRSVTIPVVKYMDRLEVEALPKRIFANAHTYHINSISLNSDQETFMSADDLRINLWHIEITNQSFNIVDIKPANMEELTEVITAAEFHPKECNLFVYSSSKGIIRLCDMRQSALCDNQAKIFEEREDPTTKNFFSEIISSISDVKFSHSGRYLCTRDYLNVKIWDLNMENRPIETYRVHDYLRNKLCILYENDCIFDKFECSWSSNDDQILSGSYNNLFKSFNRNSKQEYMFECSREQSKPRQLLKQKRVINATLTNGGTSSSQSNATQNGSPSLNTKRNNLINGQKSNMSTYKDEINVDNLDFTKKILHTSWHPRDNIIAIAATNNLYLFYNKESNNSISSSSSSSNSSSNSSSCSFSNTNSNLNCFNNNSNNININGLSNNNNNSNSSSDIINNNSNINSNFNINNNGTTTTITINNTMNLNSTETASVSSTTQSSSSSSSSAVNNNNNILNNPQVLNNQITLNTSFYTAPTQQQQQQQSQTTTTTTSLSSPSTSTSSLSSASSLSPPSSSSTATLSAAATQQQANLLAPLTESTLPPTLTNPTSLTANSNSMTL